MKTTLPSLIPFHYSALRQSGLRLKSANPLIIPHTRHGRYERIAGFLNSCKSCSTILIIAFSFTILLPLAISQDRQTVGTAQPQDSGINSIIQMADNAGIKLCSGRINQMPNYLTAGTPGVGAMLFLPPNNTNQQMVSISMEIPIKDAPSAYASASFAPNQANGCGGLYETVVYWPQKCDVVANKHFGTLKKIGALSKAIYVRDAGITTKIFFMSAGTGCVSIKKDLIQ